MNKIPEKLTNYMAYRNATEYLGTTDVELPELTAITDTLKGAGIAGEIESAVIGHFAAMETKLNFRTLSKPSISLMAFKTHALDFRGSQQVYNAGTGGYEHQRVKVSMRVIPKGLTAGKFEMGAQTGTGNALEVVYIKIEIAGKRELEVDKLNFICFIDGVDYLAEIRANLGM